jgi:hypothetical protein
MMADKKYMAGYKGNGIKSVIRDLVGRSDLFLQYNPRGSSTLYFGNESKPKPPEEITHLAHLSELVPVESGVGLPETPCSFICERAKFPDIFGKLVLGERYIPIMGLVQKP